MVVKGYMYFKFSQTVQSVCLCREGLGGERNLIQPPHRHISRPLQTEGPVGWSGHSSPLAFVEGRKETSSSLAEDLQAWGVSPTRGCLAAGGGGQMARTPSAGLRFSQKAGGVGETAPKINPQDAAPRGCQAGTRSACCEGNVGTDLEPEGGQCRPWTSLGRPLTPLVGIPTNC